MNNSRKTMVQKTLFQKWKSTQSLRKKIFLIIFMFMLGAFSYNYSECIQKKNVAIEEDFANLSTICNNITQNSDFSELMKSNSVPKAVFELHGENMTTLRLTWNGSDYQIEKESSYIIFSMIAFILSICVLSVFLKLSISLIFFCFLSIFHVLLKLLSTLGKLHVKITMRKRNKKSKSISGTE